MLDFLKRFGLGILYVLISPFLLAFLLLWLLFDLGIFFVELFKGLVSFFKGQKLFPEFPEDIEAKRILSLEPFTNDQSNVNPNPVNNETNQGDNNSL